MGTQRFFDRRPLSETIGAGWDWLRDTPARIRSTSEVKIAAVAATLFCTAGLGLLVAYAVSGEEASGAEVMISGGRTYTITTLTGPEGTRTVAATKLEGGKTRVVPVRVTRTEGGTVEVEVIGEPVVVTRTRRDLAPQLATDFETLTERETETVALTSTQTFTDTQERTVTLRGATATVVETVTNTVTNTETIVDTVTVTNTETVVDTVTETVVVTEPIP